jgi:hypothetical protein
MSYLLIKICFKEKSFLKKFKIYKNPKKTFYWFFLVFFGWVFYCQPCLQSLQLQLIQPAPAPTLQVKGGVLHHPKHNQGVFTLIKRKQNFPHTYIS